MATSQNGFIANDRSLIHSPTILGGVDFPGGLRKGAVTTVLLYVATQLHKRVELASAGGDDEWGYAERDIRGSGELSNHSSGTALDWNATLHPLGQEGTFTPSQAREIERILGEVEHVVRWGGHYSGRKDEMHLEINAPLSEVQRVAGKLQEGDEMPVLTKGMGTADNPDPDVRRFQYILKGFLPNSEHAHEPDGVFGDGTLKWTNEAQAKVGLPPGVRISMADQVAIAVGMNRADDPLAYPVGEGKPASADDYTAVEFARLNRATLGEIKKTVESSTGGQVDEAALASELAKVLTFPEYAPKSGGSGDSGGKA